MIINQGSSNFVIEDSFTSIKATIHGSPRWGIFALFLSVFLDMTFCILPLGILIIMGIVQTYFPKTNQSIVLFVAFGLCLYIIYRKLLELAEYASTQEIVEIDDHSVTVEKSGFLFLKIRKTFLARDIRAIGSSFRLGEQFNFFSRLPFASSSMGAFMIWQNRLFKSPYTFGNNVSESDASSFLESVYKKFPKYGRAHAE